MPIEPTPTPARSPSAAVPLALHLKALKLRPAMALQLFLPQPAEPPLEVQFLAAIEGKGVMVGPHAMTAGGIVGLPMGSECNVRGFTGQHDFVFPSRVLQTFVEPFAYALLAYPATVEARQVRQALRIKTSLPGQVSLPGGTASIDVTVVDLSIAGALLHAPTSVGAVGDMVHLSFSMDIDALQVDLVLLATICHSHKSAPDHAVRIGLLFKEVSRNDALALRYFSRAPGE